MSVLRIKVLQIVLHPLTNPRLRPVRPLMRGFTVEGIDENQAIVPCPRCGTSNISSANFCGNCSLELNSVVDRPVVTKQSFSTRIEKGVNFVKFSFKIIKAQPGLIAVPVIAMAAIIVVVLLASFIASPLPSVLAAMFWIAALVSATTISVTSQAVIVHRVMSTIRGSQGTNQESLQAVMPHIKAFASWGALLLGIGTLVRSLERIGIAGLIAIFANLVWSTITFFVVPVIVFEGLDLKSSINRSRNLVKNCWGEEIVGIGLISLLVVLSWIAVFALFMFLIFANLLLLALAVWFLAIIAINLAISIVSPVLNAALYHYAITGEVPLGLTAEDLAGAFRPRRRLVSAIRPV